VLLGADDEEGIAVGEARRPEVGVAQVAGGDADRAHHVEDAVDVDALHPGRALAHDRDVVPRAVEDVHAALEGVAPVVGRTGLGAEPQHATLAEGAVAVDGDAPVRTAAVDVPVDEHVAVDPVDVGDLGLPDRAPSGGRGDVLRERPAHPQLDREIAGADVGGGGRVDADRDPVDVGPAARPREADRGGREPERAARGEQHHPGRAQHVPCETPHARAR
jgi:hypothetical protein